MKEQAINTSFFNRQKIGKSKAEDLVIKFNPILKLENDMKHEIAMEKVSMTYSWNISDQYKNNKMQCSPSNGQSWETMFQMVCILIQT